jgi:hypothetical protein
MTLLDQLAEIVTPTSILASALLGLLIGAFYGFILAPEKPPLYPWGLLIVGWAFISTFAVWALLFETEFQPVYHFGRAILWTVTVSCIPIGRYGRHLIATRRAPRD